MMEILDYGITLEFIDNTAPKGEGPLVEYDEHIMTESIDGVIRILEDKAEELRRLR